MKNLKNKIGFIQIWYPTRNISLGVQNHTLYQLERPIYHVVKERIVLNIIEEVITPTIKISGLLRI